MMMMLISIYGSLLPTNKKKEEVEIVWHVNCNQRFWLGYTYHEAYSETTKSVTHGTMKEIKVRKSIKTERRERKQKELLRANLIQLIFLQIRDPSSEPTTVPCSWKDEIWLIILVWCPLIVLVLQILIVLVLSSLPIK